MSSFSSTAVYLGAVLVAVISAKNLTAQSAIALMPPVSFEDVGACPFEGCVYREWVANRPVDVRIERRTTAPIMFHVKAGEKVTALTGVVVTLKAGRVQFREPQDLSTSNGQIHIMPRQTLYLLTYQGEGYTKAWFNEVA